MDNCIIIGLFVAFWVINQVITEDVAQFCLKKNLGEIVSHPHNCRAYIICNRQPEVYYCDSKFHYDNEHKICNWPEFANCQAEVGRFTTYAPFMAIDIESGNMIDPLTAYDPNNITCRHFGAYFLPHPTICRSYILCAYGHMHKHSCGHGSLWNYKLKQCVLNINAECYRLTRQEAEEIEESLIGHTNDPNIVCHPLTTQATTPASTTLTAAKVTYTTIQIFSTTTTHRPHATTINTLLPSRKPNSPLVNIVCPHKKQSYVAHPKDCNKYFICIAGNPVLTSCPQGLLWDSKKEFCDLDRNVECVV